MTTAPLPDQATTKQRDDLRKQCLQARGQMSGRRRWLAESRISEYTLSLAFSLHAQHVAGYAAVRGEVSLDQALTTLSSAGCFLYLPRVTGTEMAFHKLGRQTFLRRSPHRILEPVFSPWRPARQLDLVLVPLVGFDKHGTRLGYGAGHYDRHFAYKRELPNASPLLCGIAFECQRIEFLKRQPWDVPLNLIITERGVHRYIEQPKECTT